MTPPSVREERRRSQRIPLGVPLVVVSLDPQLEFYRRLGTVEVSNHGCLLRANRPFPRGARLRLDILTSKRSATASIIRSDPVGSQVKVWNVALELDKPGDVWEFQSLP